MADSQERGFGQKLNTWVQTIGIIIAALWGVYTFYVKEIKLPKTAPINITLNLKLKKVDSSSNSSPLVPVEMSVSATNPSTRTIYLLPSAFIVYAHRVNKAIENDVAFKNTADALLMNSHPGMMYVERHAVFSQASVVAVGQLFADFVLKPSETSARTLIFHIPRNEYGMLEVQIFIVSKEVRGALELEWTLDKNEKGGWGLKPLYYRVGKKGERTLLLKDDEIKYYDEAIELQSATASAELSLLN